MKFYVISNVQMFGGGGLLVTRGMIICPINCDVSGILLRTIRKNNNVNNYFSSSQNNIYDTYTYNRYKKMIIIGRKITYNV